MPLVYELLHDKTLLVLDVAHDGEELRLDFLFLDLRWLQLAHAGGLFDEDLVAIQSRSIDGRANFLAHLRVLRVVLGEGRRDAHAFRVKAV